MATITAVAAASKAAGLLTLNPENADPHRLSPGSFLRVETSVA
jgi:hypothetical protein